MAISAIIQDASKLDGLMLCEDPIVVSLQKKHINSVRSIITANYDVYHVEAQGPAQIVALTELTKAVRHLGPGKVFPITASVYDSWHSESGLTEKGSNKSRQEVKEQANEKVNALLESAIAAKASDVHINVRESTKIFFRIAGTLVFQQQWTAEIGHSVVTSMFQHYAKTAHGAKESARDGKFYHNVVDGRCFMVRLNKLLMVDNGVTCKCRLRETEEKVDLSMAGYNERQQQQFKTMLSRGSGLLVITGSVNSGKSTTMTSLLRDIPDHFAVLEVSDTVEVRLPGVCHVELPSDGEGVDERIASIQDAVVRQDSDYLAIGEIRNRVTAAQAEIMGLQGKFVLSTGHSSDCMAFYQRMISPMDFGMSQNTVLAPGFMVGLVSQSLVEALCPSCCLDRPTDEAVTRSSFNSADELIEFFRGGLGSMVDGFRYHKPGGCDTCNSTGLSGRTVVAEVMPFDDELRTLLRNNDYAGMPAWMAARQIDTKHGHALDKVKAGKLDLLQVARRISPLGPDTLGDRWGIA